MLRATICLLVGLGSAPAIALAQPSGPSAAPPVAISPPPVAPLPPPARAAKQFAVGYARVLGLGYYGADVLYAPAAWSVGLNVVALPGTNAGFAIAPKVQVNLNLFATPLAPTRDHSLYTSVSYGRLFRSFGDIDASGSCWAATGGYEYRGKSIGFWLGAGLAAQGEVSGTRGTVTVAQPPGLSTTWDGGLRLWF